MNIELESLVKQEPKLEKISAGNDSEIFLEYGNGDDKRIVKKYTFLQDKIKDTKKTFKIIKDYKKFVDTVIDCLEEKPFLRKISIYNKKKKANFKKFIAYGDSQEFIRELEESYEKYIVSFTVIPQGDPTIKDGDVYSIGQEFIEGQTFYDAEDSWENTDYVLKDIEDNDFVISQENYKYFLDRFSDFSNYIYSAAKEKMSKVPKSSVTDLNVKIKIDPSKKIIDLYFTDLVDDIYSTYEDYLT